MFNLVSWQYRQSGKCLFPALLQTFLLQVPRRGHSGFIVHERPFISTNIACTHTHLCLCACGKKWRGAAKAVSESRCASHNTSRPHTHSAPLRDHSVSLLLAQEFHYSSPKFLESANLCQPLLTFYLGPRTHTLAHTRTHSLASSSYAGLASFPGVQGARHTLTSRPILRVFLCDGREQHGGRKATVSRSFCQGVKASRFIRGHIKDAPKEHSKHFFKL